MPRRPSGKPVGRPAVEINWEQFKELCTINCTLEEICAVLGVCRDTLYDRVQKEYGVSLSTKYEEYAQFGKTSLRRAQWGKAIREKSEGMMKWLGVNHLGQKNAVNLEGQINVGITPQDILDLMEKEKNGSNK